jgi:hypothetical protein
MANLLALETRNVDAAIAESLAESLRLEQPEEKKNQETNNTENNTPHVPGFLQTLVNNVIQRQGTCRILDLGSGAPPKYGGSYGSFRVTEASRAEGKDVTLTAVDVIFPPLSIHSIEWDRQFDFVSLINNLNGKGVDCIGSDIGTYVEEAATSFMESVEPGKHPSLYSSKRFDIIVSREVFNNCIQSFQCVRQTHLSESTLLNPHGFYVIDHMVTGRRLLNRGENNIPFHHVESIERAQTTAKKMGVSKVYLKKETPDFLGGAGGCYTLRTQIVIQKESCAGLIEICDLSDL